MRVSATAFALARSSVACSLAQRLSKAQSVACWVGKNFVSQKMREAWVSGTCMPFICALVAKMGWRLAANPDSLWARVIRGKYFPNGSFWSADLKKGASWLWRSIFEGIIIAYI